jgi:hypothetical protein
MTRTRFLRLALLACIAGACGAPSAQAGESLWSRLRGAWISDATYLDGHMKPNVQQYATIMLVEPQGDAIVQTEWKYYPDTPLARGMSQGATRPGEGLLTAGRWIGRPTPAPRQAIDFGAGKGAFDTVAQDSAIATLHEPGATGPRYRIWATLVDADHFVMTYLGLHAKAEDGAAQGELKGLSVFRFRRIPVEKVPAERERLQREYAIAVVSDGITGDGKPKRLDARPGG